MNKLLIIDDEYDAYENVLFALKHIDGIEVEWTAYAGNVQDAVKLIEEKQPDIILLDIEMPVENGFALFRYIDYTRYKIIFITAYDEFAIRAFDFNAVSYLLKPIDKDELLKALQKADVLIRNDYLLESINQIESKTLPDYIVLKIEDSYRKVLYADILYVEAKAMYSVMHIKDSKGIHSQVMSHPLSYYENLLPGHLFLRVHKSYLVQTESVSKIEKEHIHFIDNSITIPIAKRRLNYVVSKFKN